MNEKAIERPRILIVDDVSENLHALVAILRHTYAIAAATTWEATPADAVTVRALDVVGVKVEVAPSLPATSLPAPSLPASS